jgi:hypothetical protein
VEHLDPVNGPAKLKNRHEQDGIAWQRCRSRLQKSIGSSNSFIKDFYGSFLQELEERENEWPRQQDEVDDDEYELDDVPCEPSTSAEPQADMATRSAPAPCQPMDEEPCPSTATATGEKRSQQEEDQDVNMDDFRFRSVNSPLDRATQNCRLPQRQEKAHKTAADDSPSKNLNAQ